MTYDWNFSFLASNAGLLAHGLGNTLLVTVIALTIGLAGGLLLALLRLSRIWPLRACAACFVEVFRALPPLVQLYWFFFAMPRLTGLRMTPFEASVVALSLVACAFIAEVFRGGILAVPRGQWEAAKAIGLSPARTMTRVILPQVLQRNLPIFLERAIELLKTSTIASAISYTDLLFAAQDISFRTYRTLEAFTVVALMFFLLIFLCSRLTHMLERHMARSGAIRVH